MYSVQVDSCVIRRGLRKIGRSVDLNFVRNEELSINQRTQVVIIYRVSHRQ